MTTSNTATVIDHDSGVAIPEETQKGIAEMNRVAAGLEALREQYSHDPDCSTDEGYEQAKAEQKAIAKTRIAVEKAHKAGKAFYLEGGRRIDAMKREILDVVSPLEESRKAAVKAVDDEKARIEREKAEAEQRRIDTIEARIAEIKETGTLLSTATTPFLVETLMDDLDKHNLSDFDEFHEQAADAIERARAAGATRKTELLEQAARQAELDKLRAEREAQEAKLREEQEQVERERAEIAAERQRLQDEREAEARRAAIADAERKAAAKAERERKEAAERAEREKEEAAERARLEAIAEEQRKREEAERQAAEAEAERQRIAALQPDHRKLADWMTNIDKLPAMKTKDGKAAAAAIRINLDNISDIIDTMVPDELEVA